jgi:futalosine hydrolase
MLLLVSATPYEIAPTLAYLDEHPAPQRVEALITGVGVVATAWALGRRLALDPRPQLVVQAGVAGAIDRSLALGDVVHVVSERFADLGVEEADGRFTDLFELGLIERNEPPFRDGALLNPQAREAGFLPRVQGLTASTVHGYAPSIEAVRARLPGAQVETMEGAAFFYACLQAGVPFVELRAISNYVEPRDRAGWALGLAIDRLNKAVLDLISVLL